MLHDPKQENGPLDSLTWRAVNTIDKDNIEIDLPHLLFGHFSTSVDQNGTGRFRHLNKSTNIWRGS